MATDGGGWTRMMVLGADTRYFDAKWSQPGSDNVTVNGTPADLSIAIGPAYQGVPTFNDLLFADPANASNWFSINSLSVAQSAYALLSPSRSVLQTAAANSLVVPVTNATQVRKSGSWDFGNPEGALVFNACSNGNQSDTANECTRLGPKFTLNGTVQAWHGFGEIWDNGTAYHSSRLTYFL